MTPIEFEIRQHIAVEGPMSVMRYMALCLQHPVYGYYGSRDPIGAEGDFTTAPEISQMFGELIGLWAADTWERIGRPQPIHLVELGPGRGTLMADALRAARVAPQFRSALRVDLIEIGAKLRTRQREALIELGVPILWHRDLAQVPDAPLIVIANEFLDTLPVSQMVRLADGWHERVIGVAHDELVFALRAEAFAGVGSLLPDAVREAPPGAVYEWRVDDPIRELAARLVRNDGVALLIDYGHVTSAIGETLQAVCHHRHVDLLEAPGEVDLTAHVDFAAVARAAVGAGARVRGPIPQGDFLRRLGIEARAAALKSTAAPPQAAEIDAGLTRLCGSGEGQMGELFKVIAICDPRIEQKISGFDD